MQGDKTRRTDYARHCDLVEESRRILQVSVCAIQASRRIVSESKRNLAYCHWLRSQRQRRSI